MTLRYLRLFLHPQHFHLIIQFHDTRPLQFLDRRLLMAHDTRCAFLPGEIYKLLKTEKQQIIRCHHQHVIIYLQLLHREQQITHRPQSRFVT